MVTAMNLARLRLAALFACGERFLAALRDFLRGFVGVTQVGSDAHSVRCALARRAEGRRSCC